MSDVIRDCRRACLDCHEACLRAAAYLQASESAVAHLRLLFNTAEIARATAGLLQGDLDVAERASRVCVELCERVTRYCDGVPGDATMRACAEACRSCAEACRLVANTAVEIPA